MNAYEAVKAGVSKPAPMLGGSVDPSACAAHGCPCRGTWSAGSTGSYTCRWHTGMSMHRWPVISEKLREHLWLIDFVSEVLVLQDTGRVREWVGRADEFWRHEPEMQPQGQERKSANMYVWRLREYLAWRVGVLDKRPSVRVPLGVKMAAESRARISPEEQSC